MGTMMINYYLYIDILIITGSEAPGALHADAVWNAAQ